MTDLKFRREPTSNALISADGVGLEAYKTRKAQANRVEQLESDINTFKAEIGEIKALLQQLINNKD